MYSILVTLCCTNCSSNVQSVDTVSWTGSIGWDRVAFKLGGFLYYIVNATNCFVCNYEANIEYSISTV